MSNEVEFNSLTGNDEVKVKLEQPSRVPQKPSDEEVAKYSKTRIVLVIFFSLIIIAMVVAAVVIIVISPKCSKAKVVDKSWFKHEIVYQISPSSFKGDLKGMMNNLTYFEGLGVKILCLDPIYDEDFKNVSSKFGKMSDFEELVKKAKEKGIKIVLSFVPNYTSDKNKWFVDSKSKVTSAKRGWYVWRDTANNWVSVKGGSAWKKDPTTNQYYLHQFSENQPDLNLRNESVIDELNKVLSFWVGKGVEGFKAVSIQYLLEDKEFRNEREEKNYPKNDTVAPSYDMVGHNQTYDLPGNLDIVKKFRAALDKEQSHKLLILEVKGNNIAKFYKESDLPTFTGLVTDVKKSDVSRSVNKTVSNYLASISKNDWPNFAISLTGDRVADRLGANLVDVMNVLVLTLPGTPTTYYGEELGMDNVGVSAPVKWDSVVTSQKKSKTSHYSVYQAAAKLRQKDAFKTTKFKVVHVDAKVFAYTRGDKYLVIINFDGSKWNEDFTGISARGKVVFDSKFELVKDKSLDVNKVALEGGQAIIIELEKDHRYE